MANAMLNPFEPGTYGHTFFERVKGLPLARLREMDAANEADLTYTVAAECARMVRAQALFAAIEATK